MTRPFRFDRAWNFPVPVSELWRQVTDTASYETWWPWLRNFEAEGIATGATARATIRAPLPYALRVHLRITEVEAHSRIGAMLGGDLEGPASLRIGALTPDSAWARITWRLHVTRPALATAARLARPVLEWGHDWVVDSGVRQFRRQALRLPSAP